MDGTVWRCVHGHPSFSTTPPRDSVRTAAIAAVLKPCKQTSFVFKQPPTQPMPWRASASGRPACRAALWPPRSHQCSAPARAAPTRLRLTTPT
eukprot:3098990-Prymnesium_polylepis.1